MLDIIMPHYKEPWEVGKKFFDMLDLQRGVDFSKIRVILVQDGEEGTLPPITGKKYKVDMFTIPHGGVSAARNFGMKQATSDWIMFCDFDDLFANVYAVADIINVLPADDYDMIWADYISEDKLVNGQMVLHMRKYNMVFIHGKIYRRQFLIDNDLWFDEELSFNEDSAFNSIANTVWDPKRIGKLNPTAPLYIWTFTEGSVTASRDSHGKALIGLYLRNKKVCEAFKTRLPLDRFCAMVSRVAWDTYHALCVDGLPEDMQWMVDDFKNWWKEYKVFYPMVDPEILKEVIEISHTEHTLGDQEEEARWGCDHVGVHRDITFEEWIKEIEA